MEIQLQPPAPQMPEISPQFRDVRPSAAVQQAEKDLREYEQLRSSAKTASPVLWIIGLLVLIAGIVLMVAKNIPYVLILGVILTLLGVILQLDRINKNKQLQTQVKLIARKYAPLETNQWVVQAQRYADTCEDYEANLSDYRNQQQQLNARLKVLLHQIEAVTDGQSAARCEQETETAIQQHKAYADALREKSRVSDMVATLESSHRQTEAPEMPDTLAFTMEETERLLSDVAVETRNLHLRLGQCQGRMEALGSVDVLRQQLQQVNGRICRLEQIYDATLLAQQTLEKAKQELQRRFAPRISQRAQELFALLTGGRYQRLLLDQELSVSTAAEGEDTLHGALWRSEGTADQMYLALRLAVAEELTPDAPLVLDDAFVRFDDDRLKAALNILNQTGESKQVVLFTCQSRESKIMEELL